MRAGWLLGLLSLIGCAAPDAGTYCNYDYHCISGSCTWHSCDAYPDCWPSCGDDDEPEAPTPAWDPPRRPSLDAGTCQPLRLCSELSLVECRRDPGCEVIAPCFPDGGAPISWFDLTDAGKATRCGQSERCAAAWWSTDTRIHPLGAPACF